MKLLSLFPFVAAAMAFPSRSTETLPYVSPLPGDSRSPCPGLNALANHGYLPHDGRNITGPMMVAAFSKAMNFDEAVSQAAVDTNFKGIGVNQSVGVDLEVFFVPNVTDARCSVARDDYQKPLNPARVSYALNQTCGSSVTPDSWGKVRVAIEALTTDPPPYDKDIAGGEGTGALMFLSTSENSHPDDGDYASVRSRKDWIMMFMAEDRFPIELGWKPQAVSPKLVDLGSILGVIAAGRSKALAALGH
ncbi:Cloroperoxidase [Thozetella sp. PMI_491]|nr:Cloroperoxidase [Thozetella sp. PMI_491]